MNIMDLYDAPFNFVHELYYQAFTIREEREKERKENEKRQEEEKENERKRQKQRHSSSVYFNGGLSPASQAKAVNEKKFQDDEANKQPISEGNENTSTSSPAVNIEDLVDILEEGV